MLRQNKKAGKFNIYPLQVGFLTQVFKNQ